MPAYQGCPGKETVKMVFVYLKSICGRGSQ